MAKPAAVFERAYAALRQTQAEQILIERSIGKAVLMKMCREEVNLLAIYEGLGGVDPVVLMVFERMTPLVDQLPTDRPVRLAMLGRQLQTILNRPDLAAHKSHAVVAGNPLFRLPDTALYTLASLGGRRFRQHYRIDDE